MSWNKRENEMIICDKEISLCLEDMEKGIPIFALISIQKYIEFSKKKNLDARYFTIVDCTFII